MISCLNTKEFFFLKRLLSGLLCAVLFAFQGAEAAHSHHDDVEGQFECEICLKPSGAEDDLVATADIPSADNRIKESYLTVDEECGYHSSLPAQSRSPPIR